MFFQHLLVRFLTIPLFLVCLFVCLQFQLPNYKNFKGTIQELGQNQYVVSGEIFVVDRNTVEITELPVRTWTQVSSSEIYLHKKPKPTKSFVLNYVILHRRLFSITSDHYTYMEGNIVSFFSVPLWKMFFFNCAFYCPYYSNICFSC